MNLILFEPSELQRPLPRSDRRAQHLLTVLRRNVGDSFDAGLINGPRGKATLTAITADVLTLSFAWGQPPAPPAPLTLIVGLPRPQTARDILRDATTLGVAAIHFVQTEKAERSYAQSTLWSSDEWRRHVLTGAEQAFDTHIPAITHGDTLAEALARFPARDASAPGESRTPARIALDNYESPAALGAFQPVADAAVTLAIGAERGWSERERGFLREHGFVFAHLGARVLRTETAVVAALAILRAKLGLM